MKLEKRAAGGDNIPEETPQIPEPKKGGKPVIVYIMVMFIAAFLLMALSLMMHQRTTSEGIGELQHSFSAMQDMQTHQEKIIELQDELSLSKDTIIQLENELQPQEGEAKAAEELLEDKKDALLNLYCLQNAYLNGNYDLCRATIQNMETLGLAAQLPTTREYSLPSPQETYETIKADVEAKLAENAPAA